MSFEDFQIVSSPVLSGVILFVILVTFFYMARDAAHKAIHSLSRVMHNGLRLAARALIPVEHRMTLRNREVLLAAGRESSSGVASSGQPASSCWWIIGTRCAI